jgi:hypothetical protein
MLEYFIGKTYTEDAQQSIFRITLLMLDSCLLNYSWQLTYSCKNQDDALLTVVCSQQ